MAIAGTSVARQLCRKIEHDDDHQDHRLDEGLHHFFDRQFDEVGRVVSVGVAVARRKLRDNCSTRALTVSAVSSASAPGARKMAISRPAYRSIAGRNCNSRAQFDRAIARRTRAPLDSALTMILRNCSGVWKRDEAVTVAFSIWPGRAGVPPTSPAATSTFCAEMALMMSPA